MNWAADKKKYINYLISYIIRPEVCGKQPLVEAHILKTGPAALYREVNTPMRLQFQSLLTSNFITNRNKNVHILLSFMNNNKKL